MRTLIALVLVTVFPAALSAQAPTKTGPVIESAGAVFSVAPTFATPLDQEYKVAFEIAAPASESNRLNPTMNSVARFLNMHVQGGVPRSQVQAAMVVHGGAGWELLSNEAYRERNGVDNPNATLIKELIDAGVPVVLCGQTAASRGIPQDQLIEGVDVALSAMTAFLILQEQGYRVNPW